MRTIIIFLFSILSNFLIGQGCVNAVLELKLDNYPTETTWQVLNSSNQIVTSGGPYSGQNNQLKTINVCLISGQNYTFKIFDSYGDGICCSYGQGYYKLLYNGQTLFNGGQFTQNASHSFCFNCSGGGGPTPTCNDGIQNGNETGVDCGGNCSPCGSSSGCTQVSLTIRTDNYPSETTWQLRNSAGVLQHSGGPYSQSNTVNTLTVCLIPSQSYTFRILDSYGDGICCSYGQGYYTIQHGTTILINGGSFTTAEEKSFCLQCSGGGPSATCFDGIQNGNETGIDCGGNCPPCAPTCFDGIQNGFETGIDCGGICQPCFINRNIVFMHGWRGAATSWGVMNDIHSINFNQNIPNWENRRVDSRSINYLETSLLNASIDAAFAVSTEMINMRGSFTVPQINNDIIIAHSLGGVVARDMDRRYDLGTLGNKPYGGIITFGTPHLGAAGASSLYNGSALNFVNNNCSNLAQGPIRESLGILFPLASFSGIFAVTNLGQAIGDLICDEYVLDLVFDAMNPNNIAFDARLESIAANPLHTAPNVRKIAAFGIEEEPVFWRYANSILRNANSFIPFSANVDGEIIPFVQDFISLANSRINSLFLQIPFNPISALYKRDGWIKTRNVIENLNTNYKALITNTSSTFTFTNQCKIETLEYGNITQTRYQYVNTPEECDQYSFVSGCCLEDISQAYYQVITTQEASDGFIPVSSQMAFPGATTLFMPNSNHEQMKNDDNTRQVLRNIYNRNLQLGIDQFWLTTTR